jgi:hypothetical protein
MVIYGAARLDAGADAQRRSSCSTLSASDR